jgi:Ecdysteroid kinase-like family
LQQGDLKFLDWQVSRLGSVVIDIAYFVFCCTDENLRYQLPILLKIYHKALTDRIDALGSDGNRLFSFDRLEEHMRKFAKFGLGKVESGRILKRLEKLKLN